MKKKRTQTDDFDRQILSRMREKEIEKQALKKILNAFEEKKNKEKRSVKPKE